MSSPFRGDHIGLRRNPLWKETLTKKSLHRMDRYVVFADIVNKINRSNGKVSWICSVVWSLREFQIQQYAITCTNKNNRNSLFFSLLQDVLCKCGVEQQLCVTLFHYSSALLPSEWSAAMFRRLTERGWAANKDYRLHILPLSLCRERSGCRTVGPVEF